MLYTKQQDVLNFDGKYTCIHSKQVTDEQLKQLKRLYHVAKIKQGDVTTYLVCKTEKCKEKQEEK